MIQNIEKYKIETERLTKGDMILRSVTKNVMSLVMTFLIFDLTFFSVRCLLHTNIRS